MRQGRASAEGFLGGTYQITVMVMNGGRMHSLMVKNGEEWRRMAKNAEEWRRMVNTQFNMVNPLAA